MTTRSGPQRWWENLQRLSGRTPLRVKMITALLALVALALAVISVASLSVFRNYQIDRANQQVMDLYQREVRLIHSGDAQFPSVNVSGPYLTAIIPSGTALPTEVQQLPGPPLGGSLPDVPTSGGWYTTNGNRMVNVGAVSGSDNWRVITQRFNGAVTNNLGQSQTVNATLIVGVAKSGPFQVNAVGSVEVSSGGVYDTTTIRKTVSTTVTVIFNLG